ncbi:hypothetical protein Franean1_4103 [Parafrankia sp. EAN1pec]|nr:hypothetical protein Franean1_4103 [Frankia sp. EAN1pec]
MVPLLQKRGVFRTAYEGDTLREHLGLPFPVNRHTPEREAAAAGAGAGARSGAEPADTSARPALNGVSP